MVPAPMAIGLTLCHYVAVEERTRNVTIAGSFHRLLSNSFPYRFSPFYMFASLVGGNGEGTVALTMTRAETSQILYRVQTPLLFRDRLAETTVVFRLTNCVCPASGEYLFTLLVDGEWVAQRRIRLITKEGDT